VQVRFQQPPSLLECNVGAEDGKWSWNKIHSDSEVGGGRCAMAEIPKIRGCWRCKREVLTSNAKDTLPRPWEVVKEFSTDRK
jgi:hypothetical protein